MDFPFPFLSFPLWDSLSGGEISSRQKFGRGRSEDRRTSGAKVRRIRARKRNDRRGGAPSFVDGVVSLGVGAMAKDGFGGRVVFFVVLVGGT